MNCINQELSCVRQLLCSVRQTASKTVRGFFKVALCNFLKAVAIAVSLDTSGFLCIKLSLIPTKLEWEKELKTSNLTVKSSR